MKKILFIASFFITAFANAQLKFPAQGVANGPFPFTYQNQVQGVPQVVQSISDRNNIAAYLRSYGMTCYVIDSLKYYHLRTGLTNSDWAELSVNLSAYYSQTQINNFFNGTNSITGYNKTNWDAAYTFTNGYSIGNYYSTLDGRYVGLTGSQTIGGNKTFGGDATFNGNIFQLGEMYFYSNGFANYSRVRRSPVAANFSYYWPTKNDTIAVKSDIPTNLNQLTNGPGFITSFTETDPIYSASSWFGTTNNASNWNTAYNRSGTGLSFTSSTFTYTKQDASTLTVSVPTFNQNTTGSAATLTTPRTIGTITGDAISSGSSFDGSANNSNSVIVTKINGTSLAGLSTGILKNTTTTGVPSIAVSGTDYTSPTGTETLTNKTINGSNNTFSNIPNSALVTTPLTASNYDTTKQALRYLQINTQTANYTLVLGDAGQLIKQNVASANTVTVPPNSSVAFPIGTQIIVTQYGAGQVTLTAGSGVTFRAADNAAKTRTQYSVATLIKIGTDEWQLTGDIL